VPAKWWIGLSGVLGALILGWALVGDQGIQEVRRLRAERRELAHEIARHRAQREALERDVLNLRENPRAIEARAREDLGMIRKGETIFLLPENHDQNR
jgi:cell division protein FtsB